jgi:hypothetical protein
MPKRHNPETLTNLLAKNAGKLALIAEKTHHLQTLDQCLSETVGDTIAQNCRVSNYKQGILTIETANSAFATRLNFMLAQILLNFRQKVLPELIDIQVKVIPNEKFALKTVEKQPEKIQKLSKQSADCILAVSANAPEKLKQTLQRLAALHQKD